MAKIYNIRSVGASKKVNLATSEGLRRKKAYNYLWFSIGINLILMATVLYLRIKVTC